jgi:hypothetical protein
MILQFSFGPEWLMPYFNQYFNKIIQDWILWEYETELEQRNSWKSLMQFFCEPLITYWCPSVSPIFAKLHEWILVLHVLHKS